jgi:hypothetical protein
MIYQTCGLDKNEIQTGLDEIFGVPPQMKLNPPLITCREADFIALRFHPR